jgi:Arc/MetJ family transcription regulator
MARNKRAALKIDDSLLKRARRALKSSSDVETVRCALEEAIANRQTATALRRLLREGRGRFADPERAPE